MNRLKFIPLSLLALFFSLLLPRVAMAQAYDGEWSVTESVNGTACGEGNSVESYTAIVSQSGATMTVSASGITRSGAFNGTTLTFTATYPEDGGTVSSRGTIVFNGNSATGSSTWTYTEGSLSCDGSSTISASRVSTPTPTPTPAPTPTPTPTPNPTPGAPQMTFATSGNSLTISWNAVANAEGYLLYYAPYPSADPVSSLDLGELLSLSGDLPAGTALYIAMQAYNAAGQGDVSNVANFKIKGVDVIEVANQDSDIAAVVYGSRNASAVLFNNSSTTSTVQYLFDNQQSATLLSDVQGNPLQFDIAGHRFDYTYSGSQVRTTLTEPSGAQSTALENNPFAGAISIPSYRADSCDDSAPCADTLAAVWDSADETALEESINSNGSAMQRISGTALACPFWMPASACQALSGFAADAENLVDRLTDSVNDKVKRIGTRFNCTVGNSACADVVIDKAPAVVVELEQFASASVQPDASFDVSGDSLRPDVDSWATYLAEAGFTLVDVPCAESVFADIRPECGGETPTTESPSDGSEEGDKEGGEEVTDNCVTLAASASTGDEGCYNKAGFRTGEWKYYMTDSNSVRYVAHTSFYSNNADTVFKTTYRDSGTRLYSEETRVNKKLEGEFRIFFSDGSLQLQATYVTDVLAGPYKSWWEPGAIKEEGAFLDDKEDGKWVFYRMPGFQVAAGIKSEEGNFLNGSRVGTWTSYSSNGSVSGTTTY